MRGGPAITASLCQASAPQPCPPERRRFVLIAAVLGSSLGFIDGTIVIVAVEPMREALGASFAALQWVVNAYTLTLSAFLLTGGAAGDRFGKRRIFAIGIVIFAVASALCALAPDAATLIAARAVQGVGAALMVPGSLALIAVNFPEEERGRAVGLWAAVSGITTAFGPILGGLLIDLGSWRAIFFINLPIAAIALAILLGRVPADKPVGRGRFDLVGALLTFFATGLIALGFTVAETGAASQALTLGGVGAVLAIIFIWWERRVSEPMLPLSLFAVRDFSIANAQTLIIYFALGGIMFFLPQTMMSAHDWSATMAGAVFLPFTAAMAITSPLAGRLADRIGHRLLLLAGPSIVAVSFVWLGFAAQDPSIATGVGPVMALFGLGMGLAIPSLSAVVLERAGEARSGIASGINNWLARLAGLLAVAVLGLVASAIYAGALGVSGASFGAAAESGDMAAATLSTFTTLSFACAALCALAAMLAFALAGPKAPEPVLASPADAPT